MKPVQDLLAERKLKRQQEAEKQALLASIDTGVEEKTTQSLKTVLDALEGLAGYYQELNDEDKETFNLGLNHLKAHSEMLNKEQVSTMVSMFDVLLSEVSDKLDELKESGEHNSHKMMNYMDESRSQKSRGTYMGMNLERVEADFAHIVGLEDAMAEMAESISDMSESIQQAFTALTETLVVTIQAIKIQHPDIKLPEIKVPEAKVTVEYPKEKFQTDVNIELPKQADKPNVNLVSEMIMKNENGIAIEIHETYSDGTMRIVKGLDTDKITYEYKKAK